MKKRSKLFILILALIVFYVGHILISTGFFRTIEPKFEGTLLKKIDLPGAEDMTLSRVDSFLIVSSTDRATYPPLEEEKGGLYLLDLKTKDFNPIALTAEYTGGFAPHGISLLKKDSTYQVAVVNHTAKGHSIEFFELVHQKLKHTKTMTDESMIRPNDVVFIGPDEFYFTNDHGYTEGFGKFVEEYAGLAFSNVVHYKNGTYKVAAEGIAYANGINFDATNNRLYVASARGFLVKVYNRESDGSLTFIEDIECETGVDNIELDEEGNLWIGSHPNLLRFSAYAKGKKESSPSEIIKISYRSKGEYSIEKVFVSDGSDMSGSSVATPWNNLIFMGNVMDDHFLILEKK
ncbi:MAG: hypothetical protein CMB99_03485 [Flavobacteriaceae bacterium]|nr:hypothetical protein [Flavobacteriaceae bacterium]|tara:strand:+ start:157924 stop:158967 length:1044 start_codon:yes stop_codon:yes gene_type:complete